MNFLNPKFRVVPEYICIHCKGVSDKPLSRCVLCGQRDALEHRFSYGCMFCGALFHLITDYAEHLGKNHVTEVIERWLNS